MEATENFPIKLEPVEDVVLEIRTIQTNINKVIQDDFNDEEVATAVVPSFNFDDVNNIKIEPAVDYTLELDEGGDAEEVESAGDKIEKLSPKSKVGGNKSNNYTAIKRRHITIVEEMLEIHKEESLGERIKKRTRTKNLKESEKSSVDPKTNISIKNLKKSPPKVGFKKENDDHVNNDSSQNKRVTLDRKNRNSMKFLKPPEMDHEESKESSAKLKTSAQKPASNLKNQKITSFFGNTDKVQKGVVFLGENALNTTTKYENSSEIKSKKVLKRMSPEKPDQKDEKTTFDQKTSQKFGKGSQKNEKSSSNSQISSKSQNCPQQSRKNSLKSGKSTQKSERSAQKFDQSAQKSEESYLKSEKPTRLSQKLPRKSEGCTQKSDKLSTNSKVIKSSRTSNSKQELRLKTKVETKKESSNDEDASTPGSYSDFQFDSQDSEFFSKSSRESEKIALKSDEDAKKFNTISKNLGEFSQHSEKFSENSNQISKKFELIPKNVEGSIKMENPQTPQDKISKFECQKCFKSFKTKLKLYYHSRTHLPKVECHICNRKIQAYLMRRHLRYHKNNKPFKCDLCPSAFISIVPIRNHMYQHMSTKKFYCDVCGRGYNDSRHLREHKLGHTNPFAYRCDLCPKGYERKQALETHMQSRHMKDSKWYGCKVCGYKTKMLTVMYSHKKRHDKALACDECGKKFSNNSELQDHVLAMHIKVKNVECKLCGKFFASKRYMLKHIRRTHGDPKKFKCEMCENTYKSLDALKQHLRKHVGKKTECEICKRKVKESYLKKHQEINAECRKKLEEMKKIIKKR